ncbi:EAL domain-containing protein [Vibrio sp. Isolate23]|uniref:EAL domain-containing protein n=1 Tax=Vibrio sp. Isolate23 TaxID=2908533 RepID=UPI001EFC5DC1|nr:EAL domain-containing protein [Vibrio sp. Isolate23]MCG9683358.1 EAL domain-containing protein [Vibrio sp. Isolate23]
MTKTPPINHLPTYLCLFVSYLLLATLSLVLSRGEGTLATVWYPNIVAGFIIAQLPVRTWLACLVITLVANVAADYPFSNNLVSSLIFVPANMCEVFLIAWMIRQSKDMAHSLKNLPAFIRCLTSTCLVPSFFASLIGAISLSIHYEKSVMEFWEVWALGSMVGAITFFPFCLLLLSKATTFSLREFLEPKELAIIGLSIFVTYGSFIFLPYPYAYLCAFLSFAAIFSRFATLSVAIALTGVLTTYIISNGVYHPITDDYDHKAFFFYVPMLLTFITPSFLSISIEVTQLANTLLEQAKQSYVDLYEKTPSAMHSIGHDGKLVSVSDEWLKLLGYERHEVIGRPSTDFLTEASAKLAREVILPIFFKTGKISDIHYQMIRKSGEVIDVELSGFLETSSKETSGRSMAVLKDKTKEYALARSLAKEKELLEVTLTSIGDGVITTDINQKITFLNPAASAILDISTGLAQGRQFINTVVLIDEKTGKYIDNPLDKVLKTNTTFALPETTALQCSNGSVFSIQGSVTPITDYQDDLHGAVMIFQDVTESRNISQKLSYLAQHDALTELPNRLLLTDRISIACLNYQRKKIGFTLLYIDLDNFKTINDSLGHHAGDELLKFVAKKLHAHTREVDTVSRVGGDEFVVLLDAFTSKRDIATFTAKLIEGIAQPILLEGQSYYITPSIGIALCPEDGSDVESLLKRADFAMYRAKENGRNRFQFYCSDIERDVENRIESEKKLRLGLTNKEFYLHFQPIVTSIDYQILYWEALCRWSHEGDDIPPSDFIPQLEEMGLINELRMEALSQACDFIKQVSYSNHDARLSVNISAAQLLDKKFGDKVKQLLKEKGVAASSFIFEITESVLMENWQQNLSVLNKLKQQGILLAVDDFGTGYSSLSYLKRFPIDIVKIDKEFVRDLAVDSQDNVFVNAIITMAETLGMTTVAEGVETQEQADLLSKMHCPMQQGYYFGKPQSQDFWLAPNTPALNVIDFRQK